MNGLVGYFLQNGKDNTVILEKMLQATGKVNGIKTDSFVHLEFNGGVGIDQPDDVCKKLPFKKIVSSDNDVTCLLFGEVYGAAIQEILQGYIAHGLDTFSRLKLDGIFAGMIFDKKTRQLHLFTDPFGLLPVYYFQHNDEFIFSTEIKAILAVPGFEAHADLKTFYDFWTYGFALGDKTPVGDIKVLPGGSILSFHLQNKEFKIHEYLCLENLFSQASAGTADVTQESVAEAFYEAVQIRSADIDTLRIGLSLSGGLDSRAILAGLGEKAPQVLTYTLGLPGCADQRLAGKMADISGAAHDFIPIRKEDLQDFDELARLMVFLSDGLYHPHESTERVALNYLATDPFDTMLRGHGGEIAKASLAYPFQATSTMADCSTEEFVQCLYRSAALGKQDMDWTTVFSDQVATEIQQYGAESLTVAAQPAVAAGLAPADICIYLYISQWIPRQVVASLALFRSRVNTRLPYLDRHFLELLLQLPVEDRWNGEFHRFFVRKYAPGLSGIADANTGAPLNAGPSRLWLTDKINSVLRRISVPGFRHYTDFQSWQRKYFSGITEEILFDSRSLARNYYNPEGLRALFDLHVNHKKNYAHFLGTAVAIELWHRIFLEND